MTPIIENKEGVSIIVQSREHLPPHIHVCYGEDEALVNIRSGEMFEGYITPKKLRIVQEWLAEGNNREITELNFYELNPRLSPHNDVSKTNIQGFKKRKKRKKVRKKR